MATSPPKPLPPPTSATARHVAARAAGAGEDQQDGAGRQAGDGRVRAGDAHARRTSASRSTSPSTASTSPATTSSASTGASTPRPTATTSSSTRSRPTSAATSCSTPAARWRYQGAGRPDEQVPLRPVRGGLPELPRSAPAGRGRAGHVRQQGARRSSRPRAAPSQLMRILRTLDDDTKPRTRSASPRSCTRWPSGSTGAGMVIVISDLFDNADELIEALHHLRHRGTRCC